jgi:hypothetical protein
LRKRRHKNERERWKYVGKKVGKWVKAISKEYYGELIYHKLIKWWRTLAQGNLIAIYKNGTHKLITSNAKTHQAFYKDITEKWKELYENKDVKCIIWSAQSVDIIQSFIDYIVQKLSIKKLEGLVKMKNIPEYLLKNYKKYLEIKITHSNCRLFSKF